MAGNEYIIDKLRKLDDDAFIEVIGEVSERAATTEVRKQDGIVHIHEIRDEIEDEYKNWGRLRGLSTGYATLDDKVGGMDKGDIVLIGGETSNGKSALAANIAVNVSKNHPVLFITLEMMARQIGSRIMHINNGSIDDLNMLFQSEPRITYKDIKPLLERARQEAEIELVVLDYLQYLGRGMKNEEVAIMSKEMKTLAMEFGLPFIVIVSLRKAEQGKGKRKWTEIETEDLMGTGSIGYDADSIMIASRKNLDNEFDEDHMFVKVVKARNAKLSYSDRFITFDWDATRITEDWVQQAQLQVKVQEDNEFKEVT